MIVLDASAVVELLLEGPLAGKLRVSLLREGGPLAVPHLLDVEVLSAIRNLVPGRRVDAHRSKQLLQALTDLPAVRYAHEPLVGRIWDLRHNFSAYDATYIALAEALHAVLYTTDQKLGSGHRARVAVFAQ